MKRIHLLTLLGGMICASVAAQEERTLSADSLITKDARLDSLYRTLPEVMIVGERPVVKAEPGKLVYDLPRLIKDLPVDNAYDALRELPGVTSSEGGLQLAGQGVTVILNGKALTLSASQLQALLKSIPASRVESAEVMQTAPARYQVRGAAINLTLRQAESEKMTVQGELYGKYRQAYHEGFEERVSLLAGNRKFSMDFLYSHTHGRGYHTTDKEALHTLSDGSRHDITTHEAGHSRNHTHTFRVGADYNFAKDHQLSLVYNGSYDTSRNENGATGTQTSRTRNHGTDELHNVRLDYRTPFGLNGGAEMTYYHSPSDQRVESSMYDVESNFFTTSSQRINRWKLFLAQEHSLKQGWGVNYGVVYDNSLDNSYQNIEGVKANGIDYQSVGNSSNMRSRRREETLNLYAGVSKRFGKSLSMDASLAAEHYKTPVWNQWDFYPTLNIHYTASPDHILQLGFSSDKEYPQYWAVQDAVSYLNGSYSEIHGNPLIKPSQKYNLRLTYIHKQKYVLSAWFTHWKDYSTQLLYQSSERLVEIYKYLNFDYHQQAGVMTSIPFKVKRWLDSRLNLIGVWMHEKDKDCWDIPFDRAKMYVMATLNNTVTLSRRPDLRLTLKGFIRSEGNQGIYDLPASGNVDCSLRYTFCKQNAVLTLYGNDLFETGGISPRIRYATQHVTNHYSCFRELGITFSYRFGGYKEKKREAVDTSRFK